MSAVDDYTHHVAYHRFKQTFYDSVYRLIVRQQLDRVVFDECHTLLDSHDGFRPQLQELGPTLASYEVQLVLLTATLPPTDEARLLRALKLDAGDIRSYRSPTSRPNIRYRTTAYLPRETAGEMVDRVLLRLYPGVGGGGVLGRAKAIVYASSIAEVDRLAAARGCPGFHSRIGPREAKREIVEKWAVQGGLVVSMSALGLGLDVSDVRLVVHLAPPFTLRDYVQESGRVGRDGQGCTAVLAYRATAAGPPPAPDPGLSSYLRETSCRRAVLDRVMDGRPDRRQCRQEDEAEMEAELVRIAEWWEGQCPLCVAVAVAGAGGRAKDDAAAAAAHSRTSGPGDWAGYDKPIVRLREELFGKRRLARFSGCFFCGLPQALCRGWKAAEGAGRWFVRSGEECQLKGLPESVGAIAREVGSCWTGWAEIVLVLLVYVVDLQKGLDL